MPRLDTVISDCEDYRYCLGRDLGQSGFHALVIMVNPSTADGVKDDHTIRKLKGFGLRNGWGSFAVGNLFAYRATDVQQLAHVVDPIGPQNDSYLIEMLAECDQVIFGWGPLAKQPKGLRNRYQNVLGLVYGAGLDPYCIGPVAGDGHPRHPQPLGYDLPIERWVDPLDPLLR